MSDPYIFSPHSRFQLSPEALISSNRSNLNNRPQSDGLAFGLPIEAVVPSNYVNTLSFIDESFYNPCFGPCLKNASVSVIYSQEPDQNEPLDLSLDPEAYQQADQNNKEARAKYEASDKRKEARSKYEASEKRKKAKAKYEASDKGKETRTKYEASNKRKKAKAKYEASDKGKNARTIINARSNAYRAALQKGFSEEVARKKGESAANARRAELSLVSPTASQSPNWSDFSHLG
ncbi:hypothetical protein [Endozoicomonas sp. SCSIO W0465]|uniref:hypothetical protein n=1 Tax=Endozoicomonas sp. SCSIO W0465 TaxID=2918516 RepID=UPI0020762C95|nr:hypothetical protein [Endozoicomonas sp. SCSIO W0465]USE35587.1 hypothetical protein MJO57_26435 [Endozoicomonas sp. SCSIO W0465]